MSKKKITTQIVKAKLSLMEWMPRFIDRGYLVDLLNQCYCDQEDNCFCFTPNCAYRKKSMIVEEELRKKKLIALTLMLFFEK